MLEIAFDLTQAKLIVVQCILNFLWRKNERLPLRVSAFLQNIMKDYTLIVKLVLDPGKVKNPEGVGDVYQAKSKRLFYDA